MKSCRIKVGAETDVDKLEQLVNYSDIFLRRNLSVQASSRSNH